MTVYRHEEKWRQNNAPNYIVLKIISLAYKHFWKGFSFKTSLKIMSIYHIDRIISFFN